MSRPSVFKSMYVLVYELTKRDVQSRYRGSWLGVFWSIINPVLLLIIYSFVFGVIFKARWPVPEGQYGNDYPLLLFCGLVVHMFFADVITRSPQLIIQNSNYVKKVVFPLGIFSGVLTLSSAFHFLLSFFIVIGFAIYRGYYPGFPMLLLPLLVIQFCMLIIGLSWMLSALGVYFRDITYIAGFVATAMMFLSPIFYPPSAVPESFGAIMALNPLTFYVEAFRKITIYGTFPSFLEWLYALFGAGLSAAIGYWLFSRVKRGFADVI